MRGSKDWKPHGSRCVRGREIGSIGLTNHMADCVAGFSQLVSFGSPRPRA